VSSVPDASPQDLQNILARLAAMDKELAALRAENAFLKLELERKDKIIAGLRQRIFGSSSEKLDPAQLQLLFDELVMGMQTISSSLRRRRLQTAWT